MSNERQPRYSGENLMINMQNEEIKRLRFVNSPELRIFIE